VLRLRGILGEASACRLATSLIDWSAAPGDPFHRLVFPAG
jgi:hypothetical protein